VELAGQIAELSRRALKRNYRSFDPEDARIILLEGSSAVLPPYPESLQRRARRDLERLGVEVRLQSLVTNVDQGGVDVTNPDGSTERIQALVKIWAAGVQASPLGTTLARQSGAEVDRAGRVTVLPDCTLPGHPEVFVIGDMINLNRLPGVAEVAMQTGIHAARTIKRRVKGKSGEHAFRYIDLGSMATIARFRAVVYTGRVRFAGLIGWLAWLFVHLVFLTGFKNRVAALANWTTAFIGRGRRQRTITLQQMFARTQRPQLQSPLRIETKPTSKSTNGTTTQSQPSTRTSGQND
jgi:NADH dehydrogenase